MVTLETIKKIEAMGIDSQNVVAGYLRTIFDRVCDMKDWKGPIDCVLHVTSLSYADFDVVKYAVLHFTGNNDCKVEAQGTYYVKVTSAGYRAGPAGDH